jgi:hypothetical protein
MIVSMQPGHGRPRLTTRPRLKTDSHHLRVIRSLPGCLALPNWLIVASLAVQVSFAAPDAMAQSSDLASDLQMVSTSPCGDPATALRHVGSTRLLIGVSKDLPSYDAIRLEIADYLMRRLDGVGVEAEVAINAVIARDDVVQNRIEGSPISVALAPEDEPHLFVWDQMVRNALPLSSTTASEADAWVTLDVEARSVGEGPAMAYVATLEVIRRLQLLADHEEAYASVWRRVEFQVVTGEEDVVAAVRRSIRLLVDYLVEAHHCANLPIGQ